MNVFFTYPRSRRALAFADRITRILTSDDDVVVTQISSAKTFGDVIPSCDAFVAVLMPPDDPDVAFQVGYATGAGMPILLLSGSTGVDMPVVLSSLPILSVDSPDDEIEFGVLKWLAGAKRKLCTINAPEFDFSKFLRSYRENPAFFERISAELFEKAIFEFFKHMDVRPEIDSRSPDLGADLCLLNGKGRKETLVQVKKLSSSSKAPVSAVYQTLGAMHALRFESAILISSSGFTKSASELAGRCRERLQLWDMDVIIDILDGRRRWDSWPRNA